MDKQKDETLGVDSESSESLQNGKRQICYFSVVSLSLSVLAIPVMYLSLRKIELVQHEASHAFVCKIIIETPAYLAVHNLCSILPTVSVIFGILALTRIVRSGGKVYGKFLAIAGLVFAVVSLVVYWRLLLELVS